jgi:uncharacterized protein
MPRLARIAIYPVKSLDAHLQSEARTLPIGALEHDRRFALTDQQGEFIHAKRTALIHRLRSTFDPSRLTLTLQTEGVAPSTFDLMDDRPALCQWLGRFFAMPVSLIDNAEGGFPDDVEAPGPTLVSTATLEAIGRWFDLPVDEVRRRFRANLEIDGVEPFWEDQLVTSGLGAVRFAIGEAELLGTNPCQRCVVPSRDSQTGTVTDRFAKRFAEVRQEHLPAWAPVDRFNHFYRLSVNTRSGQGHERTLRVGDELRILGVE